MNLRSLFSFKNDGRGICSVHCCTSGAQYPLNEKSAVVLVTKQNKTAYSIISLTIPLLPA